MLGPTRALSAMLMVGLAACTFDRFGTGAAPLADDATSPDAEPPDAAGGDGAPQRDSEANVGKDGAVVDAYDASAVVDATNVDAPDPSSADVRRDDATNLDDATPDTSIDANFPPLDASAPDADTTNDGSAPETSHPTSCVAFPNAVSFTPPGSTTPHCYWVQSTANNWFASATGCTAARGHLATLTSIAETTFAIAMVPGFSATDRIWIGGTDGRFSADGPGSGPFGWVTGEPFVFTNWYADSVTQEPDGTCDSCAGSPCYCEHRIVLLNDARWKDAYEAVPYRSLCEAD
jgi:hypothetical protein